MLLFQQLLIVFYSCSSYAQIERHLLLSKVPWIRCHFKGIDAPYVVRFIVTLRGLLSMGC